MGIEGTLWITGDLGDRVLMYRGIPLSNYQPLASSLPGQF